MTRDGSRPARLLALLLALLLAVALALASASSLALGGDSCSAADPTQAAGSLATCGGALSTDAAATTDEAAAAAVTAVPAQPSSNAGSSSSSSGADAEWSVPAPLKQYPSPVPLDTPSAHLSVPLTLLPSSLVPAEWSVASDLGPIRIRRVMAEPLVVTIDRLLTPDECTHLIAEGNRLAFKRSLTTSGVSSTRTSSSAYLPADHPMRKLIAERATNITLVPSANFEFGPVLRYQVGEKFDEHLDSSLPATFGRRLTLFIPLGSEEGEEGGHTAFPKLRYRFPPRSGSAVIWRNYQPGAPDDEPDERMLHQGEPPVRGTKYAINVWIYLDGYVH